VVPVTPPLRPVAVIDLDGVVCDARHRQRFITPPRRQWDAFFAAAGDDLPLPEGVALALALRHDHDLVWLTGRPERIRELTEGWLRRHGLPTRPLLMRSDTDRRPARTLKREVLRKLATERRIALVLDDDPNVVRELQGDGLPVRQATWAGHTVATPGEAQQGEDAS